MAGFSRFLWSASTDFENWFIQKNFDTNESHGGRFVTFGKMTSSHQQKTTLFFFCSCEGVNLGYFPSISWHNLGCKILGLFTSLNVFFIFLNFDLKQENLKKKWKKTFFGRAKTGKHGYFCCMPTGLPGDFSGFFNFFPYRRHVSDVSFLSDEVRTS